MGDTSDSEIVRYIIQALTVRMEYKPSPSWALSMKRSFWCTYAWIGYGIEMRWLLPGFDWSVRHGILRSSGSVGVARMIVQAWTVSASISPTMKGDLEHGC